jgi:hypothetical protein
MLKFDLFYLGLKTNTFFYNSNIGIADSNPAQGMNVFYSILYTVYVERPLW